MSMLRVALLQAAAEALGQEANLAKGEGLCRRARSMGADIALFPEMWSVGYACKEMAASGRPWNDFAVATDGPFVARFRRLARELELAIALTYLQRWEGAPRNAVSIIDRRGDVLMTYAKVHTCDFDLEAALTPGEEFSVCPLTTGAGGVAVGAMICYDREFPESARVLMLEGAELVLTPNACALDPARMALRTRAFENMVAVAMAKLPAAEGERAFGRLRPDRLSGRRDAPRFTRGRGGLRRRRAHRGVRPGGDQGLPQAGDLGQRLPQAPRLRRADLCRGA